MKNDLFEKRSYSVVFAERREIGDEWNLVKWDKHHREIGYHRLYLLTEGEATITIYDRELKLFPGNIYFIPAFSVLESSIAGQMNKYYIHFQSDSPIFSLYRYFSGKYSVKANEISEYLFKTVVENYAKRTLSSNLKVEGALDMILADFIADIRAERQSISRFVEVLEYIDENYKENIKIDKLASIMNISPMYFGNYFKNTFHISPKQYILNKRLIESQRLLLDSRMSIKEIAYAVGFENENYFSEFFSAKLGISALKFRNRELQTTRKSIL
ncbi:MAG: helix-turn-helix transcriptional regulator [Clostridia bacterium]|nr:helix-turn-helix transcriptional regulator [Clostridia bacterium]